MKNSKTYLRIIRNSKVDLRLALPQVLAPFLVFGTLLAYCTVKLGFLTNAFLVGLFATIALVHSQAFHNMKTMVNSKTYLRIVRYKVDLLTFRQIAPFP